jgi:transglutaminase-like putative cysteine protease
VEFLVEADDIPVSHEKVQTLCKQAIGDAKTPREKIHRLVSFVSQYITPDNRVRPNRVLNLIDVRKGVCTEYARLLTTLARAAGVPARTVYGLGYMGDDVRAFGPHAWNEVVIDGNWVPVDPTWGETELDGAHVRIGANRPDQAVDPVALTGMLATFGRHSFRLVEVQQRK